MTTLVSAISVDSGTTKAAAFKHLSRPATSLRGERVGLPHPAAAARDGIAPVCARESGGFDGSVGVEDRSWRPRHGFPGADRASQTPFYVGRLREKTRRATLSQNVLAVLQLRIEK